MDKGKEFQQGIWVVLALAVFTLLEYALATMDNPSTMPLVVIAVIKAVIIIQYFMHASRVFDSDGGH